MRDVQVIWLALLLACATGARGEVLRLDWSFTVRNERAAPAEGTLRALVPVPELAGQRLVSVEAGSPSSVEQDGMGNRAVIVPLGVVPPWGSRVVRLRALVEVGLKAKGVKGGTWLGDEPGIEVSAPEVKETARKLVGAASIARFVGERVKPSGYRREARGALWALKNGEGDCTEAACLAVALCRARGVPARMVSGYVVQGDGALPMQGWHDWAEAYEGGRWKRLEKKEGHFVAFLVHGAGELLGGARCVVGELAVEAGR